MAVEQSLVLVKPDGVVKEISGDIMNRLAETGLRVVGAPVAPVMIGLILGPAAEQHLRRALSISQDDWSVFVTRPLSATLLAVAAVMLLWGLSRREPTATIKG